MTAYTVNYYKPQPKTSVTELLWKDVTLESLRASIHRDFPRSAIFLLEIASLIPPVGSQSVVLEIEKLMERLAQHKVRLENHDSIREYLLQFTELLDVIPQAVDAAKRHFPEAQMVMDVYRDPEIADCYLVLYIRLKRYDDSVIERLEKAEAEFLDQLVNKKGWIQLTTDFRKPGEEDAL